MAEAFRNSFQPRSTRSFHAQKISRPDKTSHSNGSRLHVSKFKHSVQSCISSSTRHHRSHPANGKQLRNSHFSSTSPHFLVSCLAVFTQFSHIPQNGDATPFAGHVLQCLQGGQHRICVRIIGIIEDANSVMFPELQTHFCRLALAQPSLYRFTC